MLKHIITTKCDRECPYCITKNVPAGCTTDFKLLKETYKRLTKQGHKQIMLTGGEPTLAEDFQTLAFCAKMWFDKIHITTQNESMLDWVAMYMDSVNFSIHDRGIIPKAPSSNAPIYAAVMVSSYYADLPNELNKLGYSGLTINEDYRGTEDFERPIPQIENFSIRINKRGYCITDETIILPSLEVITDFRPYL